MITVVNGQVSMYDIRREGSSSIVSLKALKLTHPEHLPRVVRRIAMDTLCSSIECPPEVWSRYNILWWQMAGFRPPSNHREGTMVYEPTYYQMSLEEAFQ